MTTKCDWFTSTARQDAIIVLVFIFIGCLHHTIISFSPFTFIFLLAQARVGNLLKKSSIPKVTLFVQNSLIEQS